jgi:predicted transcriptional regulator
MLGVRLDPELETALDRVARAKGATKSSTARAAIRSYVGRSDCAREIDDARQKILRQAISPEKQAEDDAWFDLAAADDTDNPAK